VSLLQLSWDFVSTCPGWSLQEAVQIAVLELFPHGQADYFLKICDIFWDVADAANTQVW